MKKLIPALSILWLAANPAASPQGMSPLHEAASEGAPFSTLLPLAKEFGVDARGPGGRRPIQFAVAELKPQSVRDLLHLGANPTLMDDAGNTAFDYAAGKVNLEPLKILLRGGYRPSESNIQRLTPTILADSRELRLFLRTRSLKLTQKKVGQLLTILASQRLVKTSERERVLSLRSILHSWRGHQLEAPVLQHAFVLASDNGSAGFVEELVVAGATPDARDAAGRLALVTAVSESWNPEGQRNLALVAALLRKGASPTREDSTKQSAISYAKKQHLTKIVAMLQSTLASSRHRHMKGS